MPSSQEPAGFGIRFVGFLIDMVPLVAISWLIAPDSVSADGGASLHYSGANLAIPLLYFWLPWALFSRSLSGFLFGLKIVDKEGNPISIVQSLIRTPVALFTFPFFWIVALNERKRGLHDMASGTYVVKS